MKLSDRGHLNGMGVEDKKDRSAAICMNILFSPPPSSGPDHGPFVL